MKTLEKILKDDPSLTEKFTAKEFENNAFAPVVKEIGDEVEAYNCYKKVLESFKQ